MSSTQSHSQLSDQELLLMYKESKAMDHLGELYGRYTAMVLGVCLKYLKDREESKDAVMQIFEKLVTSLHQHEVTHFKSWLYVTARNHCLMHMRAAKGRHFEELSPRLMENEAVLHPDNEPDLETNLNSLEKCIETLVHEQKHCVQLFYLQQKCYKEIADVTGYEDKKVKSYIQNGKRNLKICMEQHG